MLTFQAFPDSVVSVEKVLLFTIRTEGKVPYHIDGKYHLYL